MFVRVLSPVSGLLTVTENVTVTVAGAHGEVRHRSIPVSAAASEARVSVPAVAAASPL